MRALPRLAHEKACEVLHRLDRWIGMHDVNVDTTVAFPTLIELVRVLLAVELTPIERDFYSFNNIDILLMRYSVIRVRVHTR